MVSRVSDRDMVIVLTLILRTLVLANADSETETVSSPPWGFILASLRDALYLQALELNDAMMKSVEEDGETSRRSLSTSENTSTSKVHDILTSENVTSNMDEIGELKNVTVLDLQSESSSNSQDAFEDSIALDQFLPDAEPIRRIARKDSIVRYDSPPVSNPQLIVSKENIKNSESGSSATMKEGLIVEKPIISRSPIGNTKKKGVDSFVDDNSKQSSSSSSSYEEVVFVVDDSNRSSSSESSSKYGSKEITFNMKRSSSSSEEKSSSSSPDSSSPSSPSYSSYSSSSPSRSVSSPSSYASMDDSVFSDSFTSFEDFFAQSFSGSSIPPEKKVVFVVGCSDERRSYSSFSCSDELKTIDDSISSR